MIALEKLTAQPAGKPPFAAPRGIISAVHFELTPGVFLHVTLNFDGLIIHHGDAGIAIPLRDLVSLAVRHDPKLLNNGAPPPAATAEKLPPHIDAELSEKNPNLAK